MRKLAILIAIPTLALATAAFADSIPASGQKGGYNGYSSEEMDAARNSAQSARTSKDISGVHDHLQAVVNCIVGQGGPGFVASTNNPCVHMGNGALHDVMQNSDESRLLNDALDEAKDGLSSTSIDTAHEDAKKAFNDIDNAESSSEQ
ncbi:MAG TPA: hypothetical protein VGH91_13675 [Gammaproteobacteria bacterium]